MNYQNLSDVYQNYLDRPNTHVPRHEVPRHEVPRHEVPRHEVPRHEVPPRQYDPRQYERQDPIYDDYRNPIIMRGTNPIRGGMYTSAYPTACSQYGSSSVNISPLEYYSGTQWCEVGILMNEHTYHVNNIYTLEAQFVGNSWSFRAKDPMTNVYIYLNTVGHGPYGAYRTNDIISVPGKEGLWKIQIQVQHNPYILYVP